MKVRVKKYPYAILRSGRSGKEMHWCIEVQTDDRIQTFNFLDGVHTSKKDYEWVAKMLRMAIKNDKTKPEDKK